MFNIFNYKYLSADHLKGFSNYKYSSIDNSPIAVYVSHPFWNQIVKIYPMWLAPNVLTFGGLILIISTFVLVSFYDYDITASSGTAEALLTRGFPIPNWVWLFCCLATFLAHIMDGTDGKQARRTGASGPTGELFDHGIDSWSTIPFTVTLYSMFGRTDFSVNAFRQMIMLISVQLVFVTTHWEKYNTGVLFLSWCYDASQYVMAILYFVTWAYGGPVVWKFYIVHNLFTPAQALELCFYLGCFAMSIPMSLYNIRKAQEAGSCKQPNLYEALLPMLSVVLLFFVSIVWALCSPTDVLNRDPRVYFWAFGTVFSNISCRLIVAQMTSTRCQPINGMVLIYAAAASGVVFSGWLRMPLDLVELIVVRILALTFTVAHAHYAICVVRQMCQYFDIYCFSIKSPTAVKSQ